MKGNGGLHLRNEYEDYVPVIFSMRVNNANVEEIAAKLLEIESISMGFSISEKTIEHCTAIARTIADIPYSRK